ncbi:MAG: HAD-IIB family hydrolase [Oscillospiraceae bacterium]|nr:HAD-IIB family hydrolase [Oscillospiraceae bacterium]
MGKFDGILLVSDYDDTLITWELELTRENERAIRYFTGEGGKFSVATGRGYSTFVKQSKAIPLNAPCVLSNGASIYDFQADRAVYESFLSAPEALACLAEVMERFPNVACEAYHGAEIFAWNPNEVTARHMERVSGTYTLCPPEQMPQPWSKLLLEEDHSLLKKVQHFVRARWGAQFEAIFSNRYLLEMTHKDCHKGGMVLRLADYLNISREHIYCVGDNQNDIPMLAVSAIPFAPANCVQEVRDWGAKIVASCNDGCIAEIVDILDRIY